MNFHEGTFKVVYENGESEHLQGEEIKPLISEKKRYPLDNPNRFIECEHPDCSRRAWFFFSMKVLRKIQSQGSVSITGWMVCVEVTGISRGRRNFAGWTGCSCPPLRVRQIMQALETN